MPVHYIGDGDGRWQIMFEINHRTKYGLFQLKDVYHADAINLDESEYDVVYYYYCKEKFGKFKERTTLLIDLTMEEDELLQSFKPNTRRLIRRAMKNDDLRFEYIHNPNQEDRKRFREFYEQFSQVKQQWYPQDNFFNEHMKMENIVLLKSHYKQKTICQFTCIPHGDTVLGAFGCTIRLFENVDQQLLKIVSDAHKLLDYRSMLYFKSMGYRTFDFGGLVDSEGSKADVYKLGFGGSKLTEYSFMVPLTLKGRLFCWAKHKSEQKKLNGKVASRPTKREEELV